MYVATIRDNPIRTLGVHLGILLLFFVFFVCFSNSCGYTSVHLVVLINLTYFLSVCDN